MLNRANASAKFPSNATTYRINKSIILITTLDCDAKPFSTDDERVLHFKLLKLFA